MTLKRGQHLKFRPYAFTEQGVAMLSSVLKSKRAIQVNLSIMRIFVKIREVKTTHKDLALKIEELEKKSGVHDTNITQIFSAIREIIQPSRPRAKRRIGFAPADDLGNS